MRVRSQELLALFLSSFVVGCNAQSSPQCEPSFNGTVGDGTAGSEQQLNSTTLRQISAPDANQGVAVGENYIYSIDNFSITKHNKTTGEPLLQWYGGEDGPIIHFDGGVVINGTLVCPHSNYPESPITSSIEFFDAETLEHTGTHSFGIYRGSLTWLDQDAHGTWYATFANYDRVQRGQTQPYGLTMNTQFVQMTPEFEITRSWIFPAELYAEFSPMSNSGGSFGPDGWLYITGHDASAVYVVKIPSAGSELIWVATIAAPNIAGQGIAWDRSVPAENASLYGISRESAEVVEMQVPLQECGPDAVLPVGNIYGPGQFVLPSED